MEQPFSHTLSHVAALQMELAVLQSKVQQYYSDELVLRGDKIMMREYCEYFGIEQLNPQQHELI